MVSAPALGRRTGTLALVLATVGMLAGCGGSSSSGEGTAAGDASKAGQVRVTWQEPQSEEEAFGYELLRASETEAVAKALAKSFELPDPLLVRGVGGEGGGPYYDPERNMITLEYGFASLVYEVLARENPEADETELGEMAGAVNSFILAHEFAHALIEDFGLPVLGKEEDAADSIATVVLLEVPEGDRYASDAAAFWAGFSSRQEPPALADYADVHSLDLQRAFDVLCWVAGSSESAYREVAALEVLPPERLEGCPAEYAQLVGSIEKELKPHLREGS